MKTHLTAGETAALLEFTTALRQRLGARLKALKLFGSKATGTSVAESDIDVLVVVDTDDWRLHDEIVDLAFQPNLRHGVYISPCVVPGHVLENPVWRAATFLQNLEREGIPL